MTNTRRFTIFILAVLVTVLVLGTASAQDSRGEVDLRVSALADVELGKTVRVLALLQDDQGSPIPGAELRFTMPSSFAGTVAEMDIGIRRTDAEGVVALDYQLRVEGQNQFTVRFMGDDAHQPAETKALITVTGTAQLAQRSAGVAFPLNGTWLLLAVVLGVWSVYFLALFLVFRLPEPETENS